MNDMTGEQIEAALGWDGIREYCGEWYDAERFGKPSIGDVIWAGGVVRKANHSLGACLILKKIAVPPKPTIEKKPVVQWWKHGKDSDYCKTIDGVIEEMSGSWAADAIGKKLICSVCLENPITEAEYLAVIKHAPATITLANVRAKLAEVV